MIKLSLKIFSIRLKTRQNFISHLLTVHALLFSPTVMKELFRKYLLRKPCLSLGLCGLDQIAALMKTEIWDWEHHSWESQSRKGNKSKTPRRELCSHSQLVIPKILIFWTKFAFNYWYSHFFLYFKSLTHELLLSITLWCTTHQFTQPLI